MLKPRLLLFYVGVLGAILGTNSYSYPSYPTGPYDSSYALTTYPSLYPAYGGAPYGASYGTGYSTSYTSCAYAKVLDVLDQIFCAHADRKRYSSTIYPTIDVIIDQIEYLMDFCFLQAVFDYLGAASQTLKSLQDAVYTTYQDSTLLEPYYEIFFTAAEGQSASSTGEAETAGTAENSRAGVAAKLAGAQEKLKTHEINAKTFKTSRGLVLERGTKAHSKRSSPVLVQNTSGNQTERARSVIDKVQGGVDQASRQATVSTLRKRMAKVQQSRRTSSRRTRDTEYGDYTCTYLTPYYCESDKFDELLYNMLERLFTVIDFLDQAAFETWFFMQQISCDTDEDRWALEEAAITYGSIQMTFYTLIDVLIDIERMYELIELDNPDDSGYFRAASGSSSPTSPTYTAPAPTAYTPPSSYPYQPQPDVYNPYSLQYPIPIISNKKPVMTYKPPTQSYSVPQYMSQPVMNYPSSPVSYQPQQQYRPSRAASSLQVTPARKVFLISG